MKVLKSPAVLILVGAIAGIVFGLVVGEWAANLKFVGDIFIRLIQMSIVPLVASSVIVATGAMTGAGRAGWRVRPSAGCWGSQWSPPSSAGGSRS